MTREPSTRIVPDDLIRIALDNVIVATVLDAWRHGALSWEEAMMHAVAALANDNARLRNSAIKLEMLKIPEAIEIEGIKHEYCGPCPLCNQNVDPAKLKKG